MEEVIMISRFFVMSSSHPLKADSQKRLCRLLLTLLSLSPLLLCSLALLFLISPSVVHAQWEPDVRLTYNDSASSTSPNNARCIAASGDTVHVVWHDRRDGNWVIYYKRSMDGGTSWSQDTPLTMDSIGSQNPSIAVSGSNVHLIWQDLRDGNWEIYYKRSLDGGSIWSPDVRLTQDSFSSANPSISVSDSNVQIVWADNRSGQYAIYHKRSSDGGVSWFGDTCLTPNQYLERHYPGIALSGTNVHVTYHDNRMFYQIFYKRSPDLGSTWLPETTILSSWDVGDRVYDPSLFAIGQYIHVVCSEGYIGHGGYWAGYLPYVQSSNNGITWTSKFVVGGGDYQSIDYPSVTALGVDVYLVWYGNKDGNWEIYYRHSLDGGATWEPEMRLTTDGSSSMNPFIAASGSKVHVVWADNRPGNWEIYYKRNLPSGVEEDRSIRDKVDVVSYRSTPNPFVVFSTVPGHASERFALYDISGRKVGVYKGDRIGEGLPVGVYFLKPEGKETKPLRIVKLR